MECREHVHGLWLILDLRFEQIHSKLIILKTIYNISGKIISEASRISLVKKAWFGPIISHYTCLTLYSSFECYYVCMIALGCDIFQINFHELRSYLPAWIIRISMLCIRSWVVWLHRSLSRYISNNSIRKIRRAPSLTCPTPASNSLSNLVH